MHKLILLRHGESTWNRENRFTGWTDVELSDRGRAEAREAGRLLKEGGYEGGGAMKYSSYPHPGPFADTVEERIVGKARQLVKRTAKPR